MPVEIVPNTPLAEALHAAIRPKLLEVGWGSGGSDDLAEYIVLMLVNGKTQEEIAADISGELLNLGPDDPTAKEFALWLFQEIDNQNAILNGTHQDAQATIQDALDADKDTFMDVTADITEVTPPTGPRSMRNPNVRGGRDKRMLGHMTRAMDRTGDSVLHRVRGQTGSERINTHARGPPSGPRGTGRQQRTMNGRAASIQAGMAAMGHGMGPAAMNGMNGWMMQGGQHQPSQMELFAMLEQQGRMMQHLSEQIGRGMQGPGQRHGKSLFDRVQEPQRNNFRRGGHHQSGNRPDAAKTEQAVAEGEDVDMGSSKNEAVNPEDTVCKYNLKCTNKDCKFAHQSPAAPPGTTVDISDICSFGAACKNWKCAGRHPSPAARLAHQSEQDCKFYPNCQNPRCPFRHMPVCRNGPNCSTPNCKFTHIKTKCKYNPCLNPGCPFVHDEGQQGGFKDKVWTADPTKDHVSERQFADLEAEPEMVVGEGDGQHGQEVIV